MIVCALAGLREISKTAFVVPLLPSDTLALVIKNVGVGGAGSSFVIVPTPCLSEIVAFTGDERLTKKVSFGSFVGSPFTSTVTVLLKSPGLKVSMPLVDW